MRWKAIYILLALFALFGIIGFFFLDTIISWSIEHSLETVLGVKVDVTHLHLDLTKLKISIGKLQITNPKDTWRNLIETNNISFQMAWEPLFSGKIVIEEVGIEDLMINSQRKTNGKLRKFILPGPFGQAQLKLNKDIAALPVLNPQGLQNQVSTDKLFASHKFQTDFSTEEIRNQIEASNRKWQNNLKKLEEFKAKLGEIQNKLAQWQASQPQNLDELKIKLQSLQEIQRSSGEIQTDLSQTSNKFGNDFTGLKGDILGLKEAAATDFRALLKQAKLPDFESVNIGEVLFGKALLNETSFFLDIVDNLQKQVPVSLNNPPKEKHARGGQDIVFPGRRTYPRLLIKRIHISTKGTPDSSFDGYYAQGAAEGITTDPQIYGSPMLIKVSAKSPNQSFINCNGSLNHLSPAINDRFELTIGVLPLPDIDLPKSRLWPNKIKSGTAYIFSNVNIESNHFLLDLTLESHDMACDYFDRDTSNDLWADVIRQTLSEVDRLTIHYQLEGINKQLKMTLSSNIDQSIIDRFKAVIGAKIAQAVQEIRERVNAMLLAKQTELEGLRSKYQQAIEAQLNQVQMLLNNEKQAIEKEKKELEDKINQEIEKGNQEAERLKKELEEKARQEQEKAKKELEEKLKQEQEKARKDLENQIQQQLPKN